MLASVEGLLGPSGRPMNAVEKTLALVGLGRLGRNCRYMFYPNHSSRISSNRHYLYIDGQWVDPTTLDTSMGAMVGTLNADGTGGSLSYTPEIVAPTMVEGISILYTVANVVVPILSMGFNRALTAGERTALSALIAPIAAAAGVSAAACSLVTGQEFQQRCLKMKINTALAGSANDSFVLPAAGSGTYAYTVDWGNGSREYVTANTSQTKDYNATGTYIVQVYGVYRPYFFDIGDKAKLTTLQIGSTISTTLVNAFYGCAALTGIVGYAGTNAVTDFTNAWRNCTGLTSFPVLDVSAGMNFTSAWNGCTNMKASFAAFNISAATSIADMFLNCNINATGTTTNYDATLVAWAALDLVNSLTFTATNCKYGDAGEVARTAIADDDLWTFVDGGHI